MAHYTPFVSVQFSRNHRPIPIEGATYYLRPGNRGSPTPIRIGKDLNAAIAALLNMENCKALNNVAMLRTVRASVVPAAVPRKTITEAAREYNLFVQLCKKTSFGEIRRDDILDYLFLSRKCVSPKTGRRFKTYTKKVRPLI